LHSKTAGTGVAKQAADNTAASELLGARSPFQFTAPDNKNKDIKMHPETNRAEPTKRTDSHMDKVQGSDPYLIAAAKDCNENRRPVRSEDMAVVYDELETTATRRRAALLQLEGKNLTGK